MGQGPRPSLRRAGATTRGGDVPPASLVTKLTCSPNTQSASGSQRPGASPAPKARRGLSLVLQ